MLLLPLVWLEPEWPVLSLSKIWPKPNAGPLADELAMLLPPTPLARLRLCGHPHHQQTLYLQLRDALAESIAKGEWKPGDTLPNEVELSQRFSVSPGTVRKALTALKQEHLLTSHQGRGTYVNDQAAHNHSRRFFRLHTPNGELIIGDVKEAQASEGVATPEEALKLAIHEGDHVYRITPARSGRPPLMFEETCMPASIFPGLLQRQTLPHTIAALSQEYGILLGRAQERLSIVSAQPDVADQLGVSAGTALLVLDRVILSMDGRAIEWRLGRYHLASNWYHAPFS
jgi:GntR family transcriptional regulator